MTVYALTISLLAPVCDPLSIKPSFGDFQGSTFPNVSFFCYDEMGEAFAANHEIETGYYVQIDVWSKDPYTSTLSDAIEAAMVSGGFYRLSASDLYLPDVKIYQRSMRFCIAM